MSATQEQLHTASASEQHEEEDPVLRWKRKREEREKRLREAQSSNNLIAEDEEEFVPLKRRKQMTMEQIQKNMQEQQKESEAKKKQEDTKAFETGPRSTKSLLEQVVEMKKKQVLPTEKEQLKQEEEKILVGVLPKAPLIPVKQRATGTTFLKPIKTSWKPPKFIAEMDEATRIKIRQKFKIDIEGEEVPNPIPKFEYMKFPAGIQRVLADKKIKTPTPIQMQGLPVILSGRDLIGIAFTGSGKTLVFVMPMVLQSLEEEMKLSFLRGEGPYGLILCPSRELARQTYEVVKDFSKSLAKDGFPELNSVLLIGGQSFRDQESECRRSGIHMIIATPGRLLQMLQKKVFTLDYCKYVCLDEADKLLDTGGFEEDVRQIFDFFKVQERQTVLFSATMPEKIVKFAKDSLVRPITVNVGRAGAASLNVVQEVEYVKPESKIVHLLECLQKTAPPVLIFCENKADVDDIHEYLLLKGVEAVSIHGGKDQEERERSIKQFKEAKADVLVATDVVSKGLDFPDVQHVINFDMPKLIEDYVHRIGRTGRRGKTGRATTFINKVQCNEAILLDLKLLLAEAKQNVPQILQTLRSSAEADEEDVEDHKGCKYCGGLGHRITNCPKRERERQEQIRAKFGAMSGGY